MSRLIAVLHHALGQHPESTTLQTPVQAGICQALVPLAVIGFHREQVQIYVHLPNIALTMLRSLKYPNVNVRPLALKEMSSI